MSTGCLKKPSRPPPPPPVEYPSTQQSTTFPNYHRFSSSGTSSVSSSGLMFPHQSYNSNHHQHLHQHHQSLTLNIHQYHKRSNNSGNDYIKISDCHTGMPSDRPLKSMGHKSRASTSFSSTLKPSTNFQHSSHQKSRSLTDTNLGYSYLELPPTLFSNKNQETTTPNSTDYKVVDFLKTDALNKCKTIRTSGWPRK